MTSSDAPRASGPLDSLSSVEREALERERFIRCGEYVVWIEPSGTVRKEKGSNLYYFHTNKGVFRVSRLNDEIVPV